MSDKPLIFLYGTLMLPYPTQDRLGIKPLLTYLGPAAMTGRLYNLGPYPALAPGSGLVRGQLFAVQAPAALRVLDGFEDYHPGDPQGSEYLRQTWPLADQEASAWVYVYNRPVYGLKPVPRGDWAAYRQEAAGS